MGDNRDAVLLEAEITHMLEVCLLCDKPMAADLMVCPLALLPSLCSLLIFALPYVALAPTQLHFYATHLHLPEHD
jgi:hypothetical protein